MSSTNTVTNESLVNKAASFIPQLREEGKLIDEMRRIPDATIDALEKAGLLKLTIPSMFGGHQVNFRQFLEINSEIARGNGSVAWVTTLINVCNWGVSTLYSKEAHSEIFGSNEPLRGCGVLEPRQCVTRLVKGGYIIEHGLWGFGSASLHANWAFLGIPLVNENGEVIDQGIALIPMKEVEIKDDWYTTGLRGTGSNSLEVREVFVPNHRIASASKAIQGQYGSSHLQDQSLYRSAFIPVSAIVLAGPLMGMAKAALELFLQHLPKRRIQYTWHTKQAEATVTHLKVAEAAMKIETAQLLVFRAADDIDNWAASGEYMDFNTRARVRSDCGYAVRLFWEARDPIL